jgi:uncharacterized membrane-anchored protein
MESVSGTVLTAQEKKLKQIQSRIKKALKVDISCFDVELSNLVGYAECSAPMVVFFHGDLPYASKEITRRIELLTEGNVIGYGGFGTIYRLVMEDGGVFTVKKIEKRHISSNKAFERELEVLGSIKHRNLVNLRGYCNAPSAQLLIYDYLVGGSLDEVLHGK